MLTDLFAATCAASSHVFAVKHPIATLQKLLQQPGRASYFPHPITDVRNVPGFPNCPQFQEIAEVASELRRSLALIEPTAIDELRIREFNQGALKGLYSVSLSDRWPLPPTTLPLLNARVEPNVLDDIELLCPIENVMPLQLEGQFRGLARGEASKGLVRRVAGYVGRLRDRINEDITWRDHHLVDQCGRLAVYRPLYGGRTSIGVRRELKYLGKMAATGLPVRSSVVYHPDEDERQYIQKSLAPALVNAWDTVPEIHAAARPRFTPAMRAKLQAKVAQALVSHTGVEDRAEAAKRAFEEVARVEPPVSQVGAMTEGDIQPTLRAREQILDRVRSEARTTLTVEPYLDKVVEQCAGNLACVTQRQEFLDNAVSSS